MGKNIKSLPYGMGTMYETQSGTIEYKKVLTLKNGQRKRKTVHGKTQKECIEKMDQLEKRLNRELPQKEEYKSLIDAMTEWNVSKKPKLKEQSFNRKAGTIKNQIGKSDWANFYYQSLTPFELQQMLNNLNEQGYSHSVIKKTYDCLNEFYREKSKLEGFANPMGSVVKWEEENVTTKKKEIEYFDLEDMLKFVDYAGARYKTGKLRFAMGFVLAANLFMGLRIGELLALRWEDVDFEKRTINVCKTLIEAKNPEYNEKASKKMKEQGIKKIIFKIQETTKTKENRYVPINDNALKLLMLHKENAIYTCPEDFVISTINRKTSTPKNVSDTIKAIVTGAGISIQKWNTHILRHSCATWLFEQGIDLPTIAEILGNSVEVLKKTYIHFNDSHMQSVASERAVGLPTLDLDMNNYQKEPGSF